MDLSDKVAVVTGAGSGLGRALAIRLAEKGMTLVLAGYTLSHLESTAKLIARKGAECICVQADVSKLGDVQNIADRTLKHFDKVHLFCNVAGIGPLGAIAETSMDEWEWILSVNLWGPINGIHVFLPHIEQNDEGHILSVASESGLYGIGYLGAYNVSKFGVVGLMQSLERDLRLANSPIKTSVFCPGAIKTNILDSSRNRPASVAAIHPESEVEKKVKAKVVKVVSEGMKPEKAADIITSGIESGRFWIFSHPYVPETAFQQAKAMLDSNTLIDI
ncbi:SDR family NAD(P)-dependent oxidoreductase [Microbulbifer sp. ZKSA004]|uniref:SDR family NAD(P)-dependent oxidoreductase n=1 Tax=Microbulbifer sp. ZKSA004 TaxID=3243389 RepID=UPI004039F49A